MGYPLRGTTLRVGLKQTNKQTPCSHESHTVFGVNRAASIVLGPRVGLAGYRGHRLRDEWTFNIVCGSRVVWTSFLSPFYLPLWSDCDKPLLSLIDTTWCIKDVSKKQITLSHWNRPCRVKSSTFSSTLSLNNFPEVCFVDEQVVWTPWELSGYAFARALQRPRGAELCIPISKLSKTLLSVKHNRWESLLQRYLLQRYIPVFSVLRLSSSPPGWKTIIATTRYAIWLRVTRAIHYPRMWCAILLSEVIYFLFDLSKWWFKSKA